jgi:hypothetical protein
MNIEDITYYEKDGKLWFSYEETKVGRNYKSTNVIPKKIQNKGEQAVMNYTKRKIERDLKRKKKIYQAHDKIAENPDLPVETNFTGVVLKGRIISLKNRTVKVRMESPYQGERTMNYGYGCTQSVLELKNGKWIITESAINSAKELLTWIYKEKHHHQQNKEVIDLANRLNDLSGNSKIEVDIFKTTL